MKKRAHSPVIVGLLLASFLSFSPPRAGADGEEVDLVVNKSNSVNTISLDDARKIFMGEKTAWPGGKRIRVLMLAPGKPERVVILREIFRMTEADYTKYFLQAAFTGKVQAPPNDIGSVNQMKLFLAANPGAVGYLNKDEVDDSVKVVLRLR